MADGTLKVGNIQTSSGSGTITLGQSGETITIPTGTTVSGAMSNKPSFSAKLTSDFTLATSTRTLIPLDLIEFDTNNCFDTSTSRFTVPSSGKYLISSLIAIDDLDNNDYSQLWFYKNGSRDFTLNGTTKRYLSQIYSSNTGIMQDNMLTAVLDLQKDDYIQIYGAHNQGADQVVRHNYTFLQGYKLIGA